MGGKVKRLRGLFGQRRRFMKKRIELVGLLRAWAAVLLVFAGGLSWAERFDVRDFGAFGDGRHEDRDAIQRAIDAVAQAGGGIVTFRAGTYRTGTLFLRDGVTLHLERGATILGTSDYEQYATGIEPPYETFLLRKDRYPDRALIIGIGVHDVAIEGEGVIDGNGDHPNLKRPRLEAINLIRFIRCRNVRVEGTGGPLTIRNASHWTLQPIGVDGLTVRNVHIVNYGGTTPDGLPICDSRNVLVENCRIESDDDALTLKSGTPEVTVENVTIKNCTLISRVCGFKIGPQSFGGFRNIRVQGCRFEAAKKPPATQYRPQHGVFLNVGNGGFIDGVIVEDCTMRNLPSALSIYLGRIDSEYWKTYWPGVPPSAGWGRIENVTVRKLRATQMGTFGIMLEGRQESKLRNIRFEDVRIESSGGGVLRDVPAEKPGEYPNLVNLYDGNVGTWGMFLRHVDGLVFRNVYLWTDRPDPRDDLYVEDVTGFDRGEYVPQVRPPKIVRRWRPDRESEFEVGTQVRAWTIHDEGIDYILDTMQSMCGVNNVYMVVVMHEEHRPFGAPEFPHNPARDTWEAEDSRVTFFPDWDRYGDVKPLLSDVDWIRQTDWLQVMIDACRARGMAVGAEVSHFPIPKSIVRAHPDWQQRTIDGAVWKPERFCPNNPEVRKYVVALFGDLAANYDLDYIQTCQHIFDPNTDPAHGGTCFCRYCEAEARKMGFDLRAAASVLKTDPDHQPEKDNWLRLRRHSTTEFYRLIAEEIERVKKNPRCHLRYNDTYPFRGWVLEDVGMYLDEVAPYLGSVVTQDHQEQKGDPDETFQRRKAWLAKDRRLIGPDKALVCGIGARMKATPELVKAGIRVALEHPAMVDGLALKHYDGASFGLMRAFKQGMIEAGVRGLPPILGKEVEFMHLDGFEPFDDYVEEWGAATTDRGTARFRFQYPNGRYDVRITYFDETTGKSRVRMYVGDRRVVEFRLDEDVDCWRWRTFDDIAIRQGDEITLEAVADGGETVRLDFVEFLPRNP
ncbi:MAG: hypothetical protein D6741_21550 [Planctomycetota bacterium]|nr:MAG: hypothetical protein D6741_21550 [Planctomycetota bacterium]